MKISKLLTCIVLVLTLNACSVVNQIGSAFTLSQCEYTYNSVDNIQVAGLDLGNASTISISKIASLSTLLSGGLQTIPFNMTLNMNVKNPNSTVAALNSLDYSIELNDMELSEGKMDIPIRIEPGQEAVLPISIGTDLKALMNRYSRDKVAHAMTSFLGVTNEPTKVTVKLWPKVNVGGTPIKVPAPIPVEFTFGGE